jgi:hypothetical protein
MKFIIGRTSISKYTLDVSEIHPKAYRENNNNCIDIDTLEDLIELSQDCEIILS